MADGSTARDELLDDSGRLRAPWRRMLGTLLGLGTNALRERRAEMDRAFADLGANAMLVADRQPWRCDPIPILLSETEFAAIAAGLTQRAEILNLLLADLYGERHLLRDGVVPGALVYPSSHYVRACRGAGVAPHLSVYAADLMRGEDGQWRVLGDRTARPAGFGYVLENRRVMAQVLPELFSHNDVADIKPFFESWAETMQDQAQAAAPGIALLTPGPGDDRWFEHVVLARALGIALVEDGDLSVRDGAVFLKTLRGLIRLHALLRRTDGRYADPLELHSDSKATHQGVPGLLLAWRQGALRMMNAPGSGIAQAPGIMAFMPSIAEHFDVGPLLLPQHKSRWLGKENIDVAGLAANPAAVLRDAFNADGPAHFLATMPAEARHALLDAAAAAPEKFVAEDRARPSAAPCTGDDELLEPQSFILRMFLVKNNTGWQMLPGGLARTLGADDLPGAALPRRALSKDVWVLREEDSLAVSHGHHDSAPLAIRRMAGDMPSRVADNFYWLGRYLERVDGAARLMRALLQRLARGAIVPHELPEITVLAACLAEAGLLDPSCTSASSQTILAGALQAAIAHNLGPISHILNQVQILTSRLRDRLSAEMHHSLVTGLRRLKGMRLTLRREGRVPLTMLSDFCGDMLEFSTSIAGYAAENMVRGGGRLFLDLGRRIERAQNVAIQLRHVLDQPPARFEAGLTLALELCDSTITYRGRYVNVVQPAPVFDLVLADENNPRGLAYQLVQAKLLLTELNPADNGSAKGLAARLAPLGQETADLVAELLRAPDQAEAAAKMGPRLAWIESEVATLSDLVTQTYFTLLPMHVTRDLVMAS
jgi:uncharacterized circularly permuted ATP-grasp superfamily protein/uncharacterized alpha-E superfamily protein